MGRRHLRSGKAQILRPIRSFRFESPRSRGDSPCGAAPSQMRPRAFHITFIREREMKCEKKQREAHYLRFLSRLREYCYLTMEVTAEEKASWAD